MTTYFYNAYDKEVSDIKENNDYTECSKEYALELLDIQRENGSWVYWNRTNDLKRYDERPTEYNSNGYKISCIGNIPTGKSSVSMIHHIKSLNLEKGSFKIGVEENGYQTLSTINFEKI